MKLRPYQKSLVSTVLADISDNKPEIVLAGAPGSGKTEMSFAVIREVLKRRNVRVLVLAHGTRILRDQYASRAREFFEAGTVHEFKPGEKLAKISARVVVALPQSLIRPAARLRFPRFDLVVVDEAHEFYREGMVQTIIKKARARWRVLLTGSPSKFIADGVPLRSVALHDVHAASPEAISDPMIELAASEFLIDFDRYNSDGEVKKEVRYSDADTRASLDALLTRLMRYLPERRADWGEAFHSLGKTMIVCRSQELARAALAYFERRKVQALISTCDDDQESASVKLFTDEPSFPLLIVVRRGNLGFNFPELINVVDMTQTINIDRIFQMFCRVVRPHPNPKVRKLFVKLSAKGRMEKYTRAITYAALSLASRQAYENYNGHNLDGLYIPGEVPEMEERTGNEQPIPSGKLRQLDERFSLFGDFSEVMKNLDSAFSPYARTTLGKARELALGVRICRTPEEWMAEWEAEFERLGRAPRLNAKDPDEKRLAVWASNYLKKAA